MLAMGFRFKKRLDFLEITIVLSRYTRPEVLKVSCKTQYFRVFHSNGHANCMYLMDFVAFFSIFCEKHIFLLTDFKGFFTLFSIFDVFHRFSLFFTLYFACYSDAFDVFY